jgi:hypothetical protein
MFVFAQDLVGILSTLTQWYGALSKTITELFSNLGRMLMNHFLNALLHNNPSWI